LSRQVIGITLGRLMGDTRNSSARSRAGYAEFLLAAHCGRKSA
jgi:hypothetical protein